jgi:hypothetical protein
LIPKDSDAAGNGGVFAPVYFSLTDLVT